MVERLYGGAKLSIIYLLSAIGSSICSLLLLNADGVSVGASGAIFGTFGALVAFFAVHRRRFPKQFFRLHAKIFLLFALYSIVTPILFKDIDFAAHLGGFLVGGITGLALLPRDPGEICWRRIDLVRVGAIMLILLVGCVAIAAFDNNRPEVAGEHSYAQAVARLKNYDPVGALSYLNSAIELMPKNAAVYLDRAAAYGMLKMHEKSIADLNRALQLDPQNEKGYFERAVRLHSLGREHEAIADLDQVIRRDRKAVVALSNRGWYYNVVNAPDKAIDDSTAAIKMAPKSPWAYDTRGVAYMLKGN